MSTTAFKLDHRQIILFPIIAVVCLLLALILAKATITMAAGLVAAMVMFYICFAKPEAALYLLVFSMLLSPEFGSRTTTGEGVTLRLDDFILALIGLAWIARAARDKDLGMFLKTRLNRPIFLYLLCCIIATAMGVISGNVQPVKGFFFVLKYFEYFVVYFMTVNYVRDRGQIKYLIIALLLTCVIVDVVALCQIPSGERLSAPFEGAEGEPNTLGGYLVLLMSLAVTLLMTADSPRMRALAGLTLTMSIVPFFYTLSRGSYVAVIPACLVLLWLSPKKTMMLAVLLAGCLAMPFIMPKKVTERITHTFTQRPEEGQEKIGNVRIDTSTSARLRSWQRGFEAAMQRPVFGYGVTGWHFIDNQFTRVLVETGLLGLASYIYLLIAIARQGWQIFSTTTDRLFKGMALGLLAGLAGMVVHSLGANTFIIVRIMEPFWLLTGLVMVSGGIKAEQLS